MTMSRVTAPGWLRRRAVAAGAAGTAAALVVAGVAAAAALNGPSAGQHAQAAADAACSGPAGAAYVADAGWDGFSAINTANCQILQTYNVGDPQVPGDAGDYDYDSTDEGVALSGSTLYFADAGNSTVGVIDSATLDPSNFNPDETLIHVGLFPQDLAVSPDGSQLWVAATGPQTGPRSVSGLDVISTATDKVTAKLHLSGSPSQIAFSPSGTRVYVVTSQGLWVFNAASLRPVTLVHGLGDPHGLAVSPDGSTVYVTNTRQGTLEIISAAANRVERSVKVGDLPWDVVVSPNGKVVYVANPDSDSVSVLSAATGRVTRTVRVPGGPATLGVTADGSRLWVGGITSADVTVLDTAGYAVTASFNLGGAGANSGDGFEPTGMALTTTPTPGSSAASGGAEPGRQGRPARGVAALGTGGRNWGQRNGTPVALAPGLPVLRCRGFRQDRGTPAGSAGSPSDRCRPRLRASASYPGAAG